MDKQSKTFNTSILTLDNRKILSLTGVEKVYGANERCINLKVSGSTLTIAGSNLNIDKLDIENGTLTITGKIDSLRYSKNRSGESLIKRIFK